MIIWCLLVWSSGGGGGVGDGGHGCGGSGDDVSSPCLKSTQ